MLFESHPHVRDEVIGQFSFLNDHKFSSLKQHPSISTQFCRSGVGAWHGWVLCPGFHKTEIEVLAGAGSYLRLLGLLQPHSGDW